MVFITALKIFDYNALLVSSDRMKIALSSQHHDIGTPGSYSELVTLASKVVAIPDQVSMEFTLIISDNFVEFLLQLKNVNVLTNIRINLRQTNLLIHPKSRF